MKTYEIQVIITNVWNKCLSFIWLLNLTPELIRGDFWTESGWLLNWVGVTLEPSRGDSWTESVWLLNWVSVTLELSQCDFWTQSVWLLNSVGVTLELSQCDSWTELMWFFKWVGYLKCNHIKKNPTLTPNPCILKNYDSDSRNFFDYQKHSVINSKACTHRFFYLSILSSYLIYKWQLGIPGLLIL